MENDSGSQKTICASGTRNTPGTRPRVPRLTGDPPTCTVKGVGQFCSGYYFFLPPF